MGVSPEASVTTGVFEEGGVGYSQTARSRCAAMRATWLALLKARWALTKTRMFAMAREMGRVSERAAQARGFVSRTMERREGVSAAVVTS